jgi:hypothetical protein
VDARNTSKDSDVTSGDAKGTNTANTFTGLNDAATTSVTADISGVASADNLQQGDNRSTYTQTADYTTGDGVAGEVIGAVTAGGGSASIVAANDTMNSSVNTGDAGGTNDYAAFTGLNATVPDALTVAADISGSCTGAGCANLQEGSNRSTARQSSTANTGDGVAGQVIGAVSAGATSIDARNTSDGVDITTGDAKANNGLAQFVGLNSGGTTTVGPADITGSCTGLGCENLQEGRNTSTLNQSAKATSGDGVGGEVIGAVTSAGGSASIVAANTSKNSDVTTGDATSDNALAAFVGLNTTLFDPTFISADISGSCVPDDCNNLQQGDNRLTGSQTAKSATGDGVAGQVLGVVAAGRTSLDATNRTEDSSVTTGDADATNAASEFVGLNFAPTSTVGGGVADISGSNGVNLQEGNNRKTLSQTADASSGDGVAGQVSGVVTSAGGSASVVLANTSTGIDSQSGDSHFDNTDSGFVGMNEGVGPITVI